MNDPPSPPEVSPPGSWKFRRRLIFGTVAYCGTMIPVLIFGKPDAAITASTVPALITLAGAVIGGYIGGATVDDYNARKAGQ